MSGDDPAPAIEAAIRAILAAIPGVRPGQTVLGVGWATVDAERAATELARRWPRSAPFEAGTRESLLGAACLVGRPVAHDGRPVRLVVLEPVREGRLAASLARHGEGPAALWLAGGPGTPDGGPVSRRAGGPFGPERLVLGGPAGGPHLLVVDRAASTIGR